MTVFFCSCKNRREVYNAPYFPVEKKLVSHIITDTALIPYSYGMYVDNQNIYILSLVDNNWIQVYDKYTGTFVGNGVKQGQGPGEIVMGISFSFDKESNLFNVFDQSQMKLFSYLFDHENQTFSFVNDRSFSDYNGVVRRSWALGKETFLIDGQLGKNIGGIKRFQIYSNENVVAEYNQYPISEVDKKPIFLSPAISLSPDKQKMAVGTLFGGVLEIFQLSNSIKLSAIRYLYPPKVNFSDGALRPTNETIYGFSSLCATDSLLYSVLIGGKDPNQFNTISVFDWNGKEVVKYQTDCLVFALSTCETETGRLYAIAYSQEQGFYLVYFDLE